MIKKILFLLVLILVSIEFTFFIFSVYENKRLLSPQVLRENYLSAVYPGYNSGCAWGDTVQPHPFWAIQHSQSLNCKIYPLNRFGFMNNEFQDSELAESFNILVTGGSVAEQIAGHAVNPEGASHLETQMNQDFDSPKGKKIRIINASIASGLQPMQTIITMFFVDKVDSVVSLEGYNEAVEFGSSDLSRPPAVWSEFVADRSSVQFLYTKSAMELIRNRNQSIIGSLYTTFYLGKYLLHTGLEEMKPNQSEPAGQKTAASLEDNFLKNYLKYISVTAATTNSFSKKYILFLQPDISHFKVLTNSEKLVFESGNVSSSKKIERVYEYLLSKKLSFPIVSLQKVFQSEQESLYVDNVHTNSQGSRILAAEISQQIGRYLKLKRKKSDEK